MDFVGIRPNELSQTEKFKSHIISLTCEILKKLNSQKQTVDQWFPGAMGGGRGEMNDDDLRTQTSSYKVNKFQRYNVYHVNYSY